MEGPDILGGLPENVQEGGVHGLHGRVLFGLADLQGGELHLIKLRAVTEEGLVSLGPHRGDDLRHHRRHVHLGDGPGEDLRRVDGIEVENANHSCCT